MPVSEEELFTSAAEHFIAADTDGSEQLSVEELAVATGSTLEEAAVLHAEADTDGDGSVSLSEFMSSTSATKAASLPRPVTPIRKPLNQQDGQQPLPQQPAAQQPQQDWNQQQQQQQQQQAWNQQQQQQQAWNQQQQQQQGWNQQQPTHQWNQPHPTMPSVQPTIRSGVMCRGCGIGLDPYWRFCPVCGTQNAPQ
jgi:outer membrane biosynthesis protein TonB